MKRTTIAIDEDLKNKIYKYGKMGDTPNNVLKRIFTEYKQMKETNKKTSKQTKQPKQINKKPQGKHKMDANPEDIEREN
jgi:hypothetical protein